MLTTRKPGLESGAETGAAYLRQVDTALVSGNRFECLGAVNVVVVRAGASQISITGNTIIGAEPPAPPRLPLPSKLQPLEPLQPSGSAAGLHLAFDLGTGAEVKIALDEAAVRKALDETRDLGFSKVADDAEADFVRFARKTSWTPNPDAVSFFKRITVAKTPALTGDRSILNLATKAETGAEPAELSVPTLYDIYWATGKSILNLITKAETGAESAEPSAPAVNDQEAAIVASFDLFLADGSLTPASKLYGVYIATGKSEIEAKNLVKVHMAANGGDEQAALIDALRTVTGIDTGKPTVKDQIKQTPLLEELVSVAIGRKDALAAALETSETAPAATAPPPDPRDHSLVIIGGSRVGALNNVTTAGVHVHDADQYIENNL